MHTNRRCLCSPSHYHVEVLVVVRQGCAPAKASNVFAPSRQLFSDEQQYFLVLRLFRVLSKFKGIFLFGSRKEQAKLHYVRHAPPPVL